MGTAPRIRSCPLCFDGGALALTRILLLGGTGVFGARLAGLLREMPGLDLVLAGRGPAHDVRLDRTAADLAQRVANLAPDIVVDAAGPFQAYGGDAYALVRAAIASGAHYLDLSDDADFTAGIAALDDAARAAGVTALSGVSSVPALSSCAVDALSADLSDIHLIDSVILPGNRAPRGLSVMRAILAQAGRPLRVWRAGRWVSHRGWGALRRIRLPGLGPRWTSEIGAPDLMLFPVRYGARSVGFRAGLELSLLHLGLWVMALPVRLGLLRSLEPAARPMRALAALFERFGTDRGGMRVRVAGHGPDGPVQREWTLLAQAGDGPHIPALPARVMVAKLIAGEVAPGARACLGEFTLREFQAAWGDLALSTERADTPLTSVFQRALGPALADLPAPIQALHDVQYMRRWEGLGRVDRGTGLLSRVICRVVGFPPATDAIAVEVTMTRHGQTETWIRDFGGRSFRSHLRAASPLGAGRITERFGLLTFGIQLTPGPGRLDYPVISGHALGIPIPRPFLPLSEARETADGDAAQFDVKVSLPLVGLLVRYRGSLRPADGPG